jgi:hypothetical protein
MRWWIAGCLVVVLTSCAGSGLRSLGRSAGPSQVMVEGVPFVAQAEGHCGPAALAMALGWSGETVPPEGLAPDLITPMRGGTLEHDLLGTARAHGRLAVPIRGLEAVLVELAAGHPVLVLQNLALSWWPQWHYAVAVGYDLERGEVVLHSGMDQARRVDLNIFRRTFERAGERAIVVLPTTRLPASSDEVMVVEAAAGLERVGRSEAALASYDAVLARWPESGAARLGRGNALLAAGHLDRAEAAYRGLLADEPDSAVAWNNLAHLLMQRGSLDPAEEAARQAIKVGGPAAPTARLTLKEIEMRRQAG